LSLNYETSFYLSNYITIPPFLTLVLQMYFSGWPTKFGPWDIRLTITLLFVLKRESTLHEMTPFNALKLDFYIVAFSGVQALS
jgi:hypothetical protein